METRFLARDAGGLGLLGTQGALNANGRLRPATSLLAGHAMWVQMSLLRKPGTSYRLRRNASRKRRMRLGARGPRPEGLDEGWPDPSVTLAPRLFPLARDVAPPGLFYGGCKIP